MLNSVRFAAVPAKHMPQRNHYRLGDMYKNVKSNTSMDHKRRGRGGKTRHNSSTIDQWDGPMQSNGTARFNPILIRLGWVSQTVTKESQIHVCQMEPHILYENHNKHKENLKIVSLISWAKNF